MCIFYLGQVILILSLGSGWKRRNDFSNRVSVGRLLLFAALVYGPVSPGSAAPVIAETVGSWRTQGGDWHSTGDTLRCAVPEGNRAFALREDTLLAPVQTVTVDVTPGERVGTGWSLAGLCLYFDSTNFWRLDLVETPDGKGRYTELRVGPDAVRSPEPVYTVTEKLDQPFVWKRGETYRLRLSLRAKEIEGEIASTTGTILWRVRYAFPGAAIHVGRLGVSAQGMRTEFTRAAQTEVALAPKSDGVDCESLADPETRSFWLTHPNSRLVIHPVMPVPPLKGKADLLALPMHLAYHAGEIPIRLPFFWGWIPTAARSGLFRNTTALGFSSERAANWHTENATSAWGNRRVRVQSTSPSSGTLLTSVHVDLDQTPFLLLRVEHATGNWALLVQAKDEPAHRYIQPDVTASGTFCYNIREATGWHGNRSFLVKLVVFKKGTTVTATDMRFVGTGPDSLALSGRPVRWSPHQLVQEAESGSGLKLESTVGFHDVEAVSQLLRIARTHGPVSLVLSGDITQGQAAWNPNTHTLSIHAPSYRADIVISRPGRFLGFYPTWTDFAESRPDPLARNGIWAVELEDLQAGDEVGVTARFSAADSAEAPPAPDVARPAAIREALKLREAEWNDLLARVPRPAQFQLTGIDRKGSTPESIRRAYYRAWVYLLSDLLPPQPENGFAYPQYPIGKASLWKEGAPHARGSSQYESFLAMQYLAWVTPDTAWAAFQGMMSLVEADGSMEGEGLFCIAAQTAWTLYQATGNENLLRQVYPALKKFVLWKESDPRWIYYNSTPPDQKDGGFTAYVLSDMDYLKQITAALRLPAERAFWRAQSQTLTALYKQRFWPRPNQQAHKFYPDTGRREWVNRLGMLHGWALPPGILTPAETGYLQTVFRASVPQDMPFLGPDILGFPRYSKMMREVSRQGLTHEAEMMAEAGMREITLAGEYAETYLGGFPPQPSGVFPEMGGAAHLLDGVFWHNGLDFGEGLPQLIAPEHTGGIRNLRFLGRALDIYYDAETREFELTGSALEALERPEGVRILRAQNVVEIWRVAVSTTGSVPLTLNHKAVSK